MNILGFTKAVDEAEARMSHPNHQPSPAELEAYERAKEDLMRFVCLNQENVKKGAHNPGYINTLAYYLAWKDLRGGLR